MGLILASGSPRRRALLTTAGIDLVKVISPQVPEIKTAEESALDYVRRLAHAKARAIDVPGQWVLAADTVVHIEHEVLEKPADDKDATRMLTTLSGRWHQVSTAWCLRFCGENERTQSDTVTSQVRFRSLSTAEVAQYVHTGEGRDKAGSYGIQGLGAALVAEVRGSHSNVVGLPMESVMTVLAKVGIDPVAP